jgi:hypothetical protein
LDARLATKKIQGDSTFCYVMSVIAPSQRPRAWTTGLAALVLITVAVLGATMPRGGVFAHGAVASSAVQDDYAAARARLATMLGNVQQVEGFVPQSSVVAVVAGLNQALDKLELANIALGGGFTTQAAANITAANGIMDGLDPTIATLITQANTTKQMNAIGIAAGAGIACIAVTALILLKKRHDKQKLQSFLAAEIDYSSSEQGSNAEKAQPDSPEPSGA